MLLGSIALIQPHKSVIQLQLRGSNPKESPNPLNSFFQQSKPQLRLLKAQQLPIQEPKYQFQDLQSPNYKNDTNLNSQLIVITN